ncbi:oxalate decarboxylase [Trametes coccinea BRFM310]|uniref:Oxalate decarboxylase n=1 Tax=Trametes coccinea (strain BRFM310) TaxID=1353009 RepID=A0A1Y2IZB5_TRAC3|nr:oxalate decarboxylase [Trametes coccinea BRFM310]
MARSTTQRLLPLILLASILGASALPLRPRASSAAPPAPSPTVPYASDDPNAPLWNAHSSIVPEAERGTYGASVLGPQNVPLELQNPSLLAPPTTDHGDVPNAKWPFDLSHNRLQTGGWARQQNGQFNDMPIATGLAGVDMRLEPGAIRELHWHNTAEWAYVLKGSTQVTTVTADGQNYAATVPQGSLWYFPPGQPHSLQATDDDPEGTEFLLVFDDGSFSDDSTFLLTDWLAHVPKETLAKNFHVGQSAFDHIPSEQLYIFPGPIPADDQQPPQSPQGTTPLPYTFDFANMQPTQYAGGTVKIADSRNFKVAKTIAVAEVTVEPGSMREMHWHPEDDEWTYFLEGSARITLFAASGKARTFDYQAGDIAYVPASYGHYIENTGNTTLRLLEILKTDVFKDISLNQWLALTPPELVKAHLQLSDETISQLSKTKPVVVGPQ